MNEEQNLNNADAQQLNIAGVMLSAYIVVLSHGERVIVIAKNIADAYDKLDEHGHIGYEFEHGCSFDVIS